jgi:hypothetical protein
MFHAEIAISMEIQTCVQRWPAFDTAGVFEYSVLYRSPLSTAALNHVSGSARRNHVLRYLKGFPDYAPSSARSRMVQTMNNPG